MKRLRERIISLVRLAVKRAVERKMPVYFLHIGKTGGQSIGSQLIKRGDWSTEESNYIPLWRRLFWSKNIIYVRHRKVSETLQKNVDVFFVLRNPILRFVSAFYYLKEPFWGGRCNEIERRIRDEFDTVNDFVDALRQSSHQHHLLAHESFQRHGYHHFYMSYSFYFGSAENLHKIPVRSCLIGTTEKMNDAIDSLNELAGATLSPDIHENRSVTRRKEALSPINEGFMREYLSHDFEIYQYLLHKYN